MKTKNKIKTNPMLNSVVVKCNADGSWLSEFEDNGRAIFRLTKSERMILRADDARLEPFFNAPYEVRDITVTPDTLQTAAAAPEAPQDWQTCPKCGAYADLSTHHGKACAEAPQIEKGAMLGDLIAKHKPALPKQIGIGKVDGELVDENGFYVGAEATKHEIVRRYNNAEALAEALRDLLHDSRSLETRHYAETALAQFEKAKQ
jgi:hypothetical protein